MNIDISHVRRDGSDGRDWAVGAPANSSNQCVAMALLPRWERLHDANRQRRLHLLTRLIERHLPPAGRCGHAGGATAVERDGQYACADGGPRDCGPRAWRGLFVLTVEVSAPGSAQSERIQQTRDGGAHAAGVGAEVDAEGRPVAALMVEVG